MLVRLVLHLELHRAGGDAGRLSAVSAPNADLKARPDASAELRLLRHGGSDSTSVRATATPPTAMKNPRENLIPPTYAPGHAPVCGSPQREHRL